MIFLSIHVFNQILSMFHIFSFQRKRFHICILLGFWNKYTLPISINQGLAFMIFPLMKPIVLTFNTNLYRQKQTLFPYTIIPKCRDGQIRVSVSRRIIRIYVIRNAISVCYVAVIVRHLGSVLWERNVFVLTRWKRGMLQWLVTYICYLREIFCWKAAYTSQNIFFEKSTLRTIVDYIRIISEYMPETQSLAELSRIKRVGYGQHRRSTRRRYRALALRNENAKIGDTFKYRRTSPIGTN